MSDLDDLQRLRDQLDEGKITAEEYARERAWITGSVVESAAEAGAEASAPRSRGHVIDLHEIEENEPAAGHTTAQPDRTRKRIPMVWKVILVALVVWILLIITAVLYLHLRGNQSDGTSGAQTTVVTQTRQGSATAQNAADELQGSTGEGLSYDEFKNQLVTTLGAYYAGHSSITDDGKTLTISLTGDGIAADAMYVVEGVDGAAALWDELKSSMQTLAETCYNGANAATPSRHVVLNILNDQNEENAILSYLDGSCIYDATESAETTLGDE